MDHGDVFAKLAKLPKNSTFEIETPTAVAAVRGSEFRTVCENGVTEVFNLHNSEVEVFGKDLEGNMEKESTVLEQNEKTEVKELGEEPAAPEKMSEEEIREQQAESTELSQEVKEVLDEGRLGEIQDLDTVEKEYEVNLEQRLEDIKDENPELDKDAAGQDGSDNESEKDMNSGMDNIEGATEDMEKALDTIDSTLEGVEDKNDEATDKETEEDLLGNSSEDEGGQGGNFLSTTTV
jgi:myosin heavy subunit